MTPEQEQHGCDVARDAAYEREQAMLAERERCEAIKAALEAQPPTRAAYVAFADKILALPHGMWYRYVRRTQVERYGHLNVSQDDRDVSADRRETLRRDFRDGVTHSYPG